MASDKKNLDFVLEQINAAGPIRTKRMFGEYCIYCNNKVVGFFCDDQLFVKPTEAGRRFAPEISEGFPYPGAKPHFLVEEQIEDQDWVSELIRITARELPLAKKPAPKAAGKAAKKSTKKTRAKRS